MQLLRTSKPKPKRSNAKDASFLAFGYSTVIVMHDVDWQTLIIAALVCVGVLVGPYQMWRAYDIWRRSRGPKVYTAPPPTDPWGEED